MKNSIIIDGETYVKVNNNKLPKFRTDKGTLKNIESIYLEHGNAGTIFYTTKKSNAITSYVNLYKRKTAIHLSFWNNNSKITQNTNTQHKCVLYFDQELTFFMYLIRKQEI